MPEHAKHANKILQECAKQHSTGDKEIIEALIFPEKYPTDVYKCAWACFFKKFDVVDSKGMYDLNVAIENVSKYSENEQAREQALAIAKRCVYVNDQSVSDGAAGCDRSMLLAKCFIQDILKQQLDIISKIIPQQATRMTSGNVINMENMDVS